MSGFFNVGITGINAAQAGLRTASHNIANASTPGFNRQYITQTSNTPLFTGAGFLGQGTSVETVKRVYSDLLTQQLRTAETNVAELSSYYDQILQIDNLLADPSAGLSPAMQSFFDAVAETAANPASMPARQALLSGAEALVARFHAMDQQLTAMRDSANGQISTEIDTINSMVTQIANLNDRILVAQAASANQPANDLYDQRDKLIADLNQEIRVTTQEQTDGSVNLFFGNGQPLIVGTSTYKLIPIPSTEDMTHIEVAMTAPSGETLRLPESLLSGGKLGGVLRFRSETLDAVQNDIGRIAQAMVSTVNAQHRLGQTLAGEPASDFFLPLSPGVLGAPGNTGTLDIQASVTASDYRVEYDGTNYNVTRLSDNHRFDPTGNFPIVVDGIRFDLAAGTPLAGDVFIVRPGLEPAERVTKLASSSNAVVSSTGSNVQTMVDSDFRLAFTDANTITLTRLSDNTSWVGVGTNQSEALKSLMEKASPQGFSLEIASGVAIVGDSFLIRPTRNGARDIQLAIGDARDIAVAQGFRTAASVQNAGTGTISAGAVEKTDVPLSTPVKLTYEASTNSLIGFPVGSAVTVGLTKYLVTDSAQRIPHTAGATVTFGGAAFSIGGVPADGDVFLINPPPTAPSASNAGYSQLFGTPVIADPSATGSIVPATSSLPIEIVAGANDSFMVSINGSALIQVTLPAGSYTPTQLEQAIDAQLAGADASFDVNGQLVISSTTTEAMFATATALSFPVDFSASVAPAASFDITDDTGTDTIALEGNTYADSAAGRAQLLADINAALTLGGSNTVASLEDDRLVLKNSNATIPAISNIGTDASVIGISGVGVNIPSHLTGSIALSQAAPNTGAATIAAATPPQAFSSLPAAPMTLTYRQEDTANGLPARLTGFPVGSTVAVTLADGTTTEYSMSSADGFTDAGNFADYIPYTSGATIRVNGMRFEITGAPVDGDTFTLEPNPSGSGDNRNMQAIAALQLANTMADGTATFQGGYSSMVSEVGNQTRTIEVTLTAQENLVKQGNDAIQSMSGVNLDEEAANLLRYQQAYQAAAKMIEMSSKLFDLILTMGR